MLVVLMWRYYDGSDHGVVFIGTEDHVNFLHRILTTHGDPSKVFEIKQAEYKQKGLAMLIPIIFPYKMSSQSAKLLRDGLREEFTSCRMVYPDRAYRPKSNHLIINWGSARIPNWWECCSENFLNDPYSVHCASNKLETIVRLPEEIRPNHWTERQCIPQDTEVFCRTLLTSRGGNGIVIASNRGELVDAPLYTKSYNVAQEYRVHCTPTEVIDVVQKKRMSTATCEERGIERNDRIRNHDNGWVFAREGIEPTEAVLNAAMSAVASLGLDFGAVDIARTTHNEKPIVCFEVNTAPGIQGSTLEAYINFFKRKLDI